MRSILLLLLTFGLSFFDAHAALQDVNLMPPGSALPTRVVYVDNSVAVSGDGSSWGQAYKTLSDALASAALSITSGDSILVAQGTYYPTGLQSGTDRDSAFTILRSGIKIMGGYPTGGGATRDVAANPTILSGNVGNSAVSTDNSCHVMVIAGVSESADSIVLDGLTFQEASTGSVANSTKTYNGIAVLQTAGGGVNLAGNASDHIAFRNCIFSNNLLNASIGGSGMYNNASSPFISNCTFIGNTGNGSGGGMFNIAASPRIDRCTFTNNAIQGSGAGMYNQSNSNPIITNCIFNNNENSGTGGAGIYNNASTPSILNCTFINNFSSNSSTNNTGGAGIYNNSCSPVITLCTFTSNIGYGLGGVGVFNLASSPTITDCLFSGNLAGYPGSCGGAIYNAASSSPVIINSVMSGNYAGHNGGALYNDQSSASVINCTFSGNYASYGGAIYNDNATPTVISNTIIWGNGSTNGFPGIADITSSGATTVTLSYSDVQDIPGGTDGNINEDPLFVNAPGVSPFPFVGGDYNLNVSSPAVNKGSNALNSTTTDLANNLRIFGATIDMGAYELQQATLPVEVFGFRGSLRDGEATLTWQTGVESNFSRFVIEKSVNGATFSSAANIDAKGNGSNYSYSLVQSEPSAYYRIRIISNGEKTAYSDVVTLTQSNRNDLIIYPNPAIDYINVAVVTAGKLNIFNTTGVLVKTETVHAGLNRINVNALSAGIYFVNAGGAVTRFVRQ